MSSNDVFQTPIHNYLQLPAVTLASKIRRLEIGVEELLQVFIERINVVNDSINAVVADRFSEAILEAREIDEMLSEMTQEQRDELEITKPFLGVPFTAKEAFAVAGLPNSGGLVARKDHIAKEDAVVVLRLRQAGAIPLALSNCSELCMWWESANRVYGRTCNPYDRSKIVGGSSGGEGAIIGAAGSVFGVGSGNVPVNSKTAHPPPPPPGQTPGHLTFLKKFGQIPCYVPSLDSQMPHPLELQRGSNPPPSRVNRFAYLWK